jgi:putative ABC transport system substrate-binding protein
MNPRSFRRAGFIGKLQLLTLGVGMKRRAFMTLIGGAATWPIVARALQHDAPPLVALLFSATKTFYAGQIRAFSESIRQLGYDEGRNIRFEYRFADGYFDRLPDLAAELIALRPNVIVAVPLPACLAVYRVTKTIPIVAFGADPVAFGLAASLSHPGGNVTGIAIFPDALASKQLDFARELLPRLSRVAMLLDINHPLHVSELKAMQVATTDANVGLVLAEVRGPDDLEEAFAKLARQNVDALLVAPDIVFLQQSKKIADLAASQNLLAVYGYREHVINGGLIGYGPNLAKDFGRTAAYVDKILKGANPADLPGRAIDKVRTDDQPQNGQRAWNHCAAYAARSRRRGTRIGAAQMSAVGTKATLQRPPPMSVPRGKRT